MRGCPGGGRNPDQKRRTLYKKVVCSPKEKAKGRSGPAAEGPEGNLLPFGRLVGGTRKLSSRGEKKGRSNLGSEEPFLYKGGIKIKATKRFTNGEERRSFRGPCSQCKQSPSGGRVVRQRYSSKGTSEPPKERNVGGRFWRLFYEGE